MIKIIDFTDCKLSSRNLEYGGRAGEKRGIIFNDQFWFLKFPKNTSNLENINDLSYVTSPLSEYLGSHIYQILGYDVHETALGICFDGKRNKVVCACKDFINDDKNELLIPYTALRNDTNPNLMDDDSSSFTASNIYEIILQLDKNTILSRIPNAKKRFWDVVIIDMLINNNDRNEDNWGVIKDRRNNAYRLAPIFDCGSCFYSKASDERCESILANNDRLLSSAINGITAYEDNKENRITNIEILKMQNSELKESIIRIRKLASSKMNEIENFINSIPNTYQGINIMSDIRKRYYIETFKIRLNLLFK